MQINGLATASAERVVRLDEMTALILKRAQRTMIGGRPMRSIWMVCLCLMMPGAAYGQLQFMNYGRWVGASAEARSYYIAGMFDAYMTLDTGDEAKSAVHYSRCIARSGMKSDQLADGVLRFGQARPALHAKPLIFALNQYLIAVCGDPHN
jgi:hypothetical protein